MKTQFFTYLLFSFVLYLGNAQAMLEDDDQEKKPISSTRQDFRGWFGGGDFKNEADHLREALDSLAKAIRLSKLSSPPAENGQQNYNQ